MRYKTATQWGVYEVEVSNGQITSVEGVPEDPDPAELRKGLLDGITHPLRIARPAIRRGWLNSPDRGRSKRGSDEFVDVPWDEALELAAAELQRVIQEYGNTSIFAGSYGWASAGRFHHAQSQLHRFINLLGGSTRAMNSYSTAAAQMILPHVVAPWHEMELKQTHWRDVVAHTEVFVAFGGLPLRNTQVAYGGITEHQTKPAIEQAVARGVKFINISPVKSDVDDWVGAQWLAPIPGTDVALMLGLAYVLETQGLLDRNFLASHCVGYEQVRTYLLGDSDGVPKTPVWAESICGVPAAELVALAQLLASKRTFLSAAWSLQRADHGEQPYWMLITLAAMLGQVGLDGGGFGFGYGAEGFIGSHGRRFPWATLSKGRNPTGFAIPVARISDMLLNPGGSVDYNGEKITYPDTQLIYWAGGNPFHHHQDLNRLVEAWRQPATVIVNEPWWTPTAQWADIVFPATTALEREDICASSHDPYAHIMEQALPPQLDARSDHEIFLGLAQQLGIADAFSGGKSPREWLQDMWERSEVTASKQGIKLPSFAEFWRAGSYKLPDQPISQDWLADFRRDPSANPLGTPSGKLELYSSTIAGFGYADCPGQATWLEPYERLGGQGSDEYPLHLLSPQPRRRLHSQLDHSKHSQDGKIDGKEPLVMHPNAAAARGLGAGDIVRVFNARGACLAGVALDENMLEAVVMLPTGAWYAPAEVAGDTQSPPICMNGNPNVLTKDQGTSSLAQGPSANTCLVEVERWQPTLPSTLQ